MNIEKFRKICSMMTSPNDSERATAAMMASKMLKSHGLDWSLVEFKGMSCANTARPQSSKPEAARPQNNGSSNARSQNNTSQGRDGSKEYKSGEDDFDDDYNDIFNNMYRDYNSKTKSNNQKKASPAYVTGKDIPYEIFGIASIDHESISKKTGKTVLSVSVTDEYNNKIYAPITVFDDLTIEKIRTGLKYYWRVKQPEPGTVWAPTMKVAS